MLIPLPYLVIHLIDTNMSHVKNILSIENNLSTVLVLFGASLYSASTKQGKIAVYVQIFYALWQLFIINVYSNASFLSSY